MAKRKRRVSPRQDAMGKVLAKAAAVIARAEGLFTASIEKLRDKLPADCHQRLAKRVEELFQELENDLKPIRAKMRNNDG